MDRNEKLILFLYNILTEVFRRDTQLITYKPPITLTTREMKKKVKTKFFDQRPYHTSVSNVDFQIP